MPRLSLFACFLFTLFHLSGCDTSSPTDNPASDNKPSAAEHIANIGPEQTQAMFDAGSNALLRAEESATMLRDAITALLNTPEAAELSAAQAAWVDATIDYQGFHFFRHIGLVAPTDFPRLNRLDYQISGHPIQPGFLDTYGDYKYSGLVHDIGFPITQESLTHQHGLTDLSDVVLGYYAIEFLLFNDGKPRNPEDFKPVTHLDAALKERGFEKTAEVPHNRRRTLLKKQAAILVDDLKTLRDIWQGNGGDTVSQQWRELNTKQQIDTIQAAVKSALTQSMIAIGEFNQSKENERTHVSAHIYAADFAQRQAFIYKALSSIHSAIPMLITENQSDVEDALTQAINQAEKTTLAENETATEHWRTIFTKVKHASDALNEIPAQNAP